MAISAIVTNRAKVYKDQICKELIFDLPAGEYELVRIVNPHDASFQEFLAVKGEETNELRSAAENFWRQFSPGQAAANQAGFYIEIVEDGVPLGGPILISE